MIERFFGLQKSSQNKIVRFVRVIITFLVVNFAWSVFRSPDMSTAYKFLRQIFTGYKGLSIDLTGFDTLVYMVVGVFILLIYELSREYKFVVVDEILSTEYSRFGVYLMLAILVLAIGVLDGSSFIYVMF